MYLSKLDFINKYYIKNVYTNLRPEKVIITYNLNDSLKTHDLETNMQIKSVLLSSILLECNPQIKCLIFKTGKDIDETSYNKIILQKSKDVQKFLNYLFVSCDFTFSNKVFADGTPDANFYIEVPAIIFPDIVEFCNTTNNLDPKSFNLKLNFIFNKKLKNINIQNLYPFWNT